MTLGRRPFSAVISLIPLVGLARMREGLWLAHVSPRCREGEEFTANDRSAPLEGSTGVLGVTLNHESGLASFHVQERPLRSGRQRRMHPFPPCARTHPASTLQLDVDGCVFEIDGKQRCRNLGDEPNFVGGDGAIIGVAKAMKVDEICRCRKAHKAGYVGLAPLLKIEHCVALPITVVLDRAEQAVERTGALLYRGAANKGSSAAFAVNEPFIVQATHGVAHGVSTRFVLHNQFALGRKPGLELPTGESTPEVFEHLGPERHRAGTVGPPGNIYHGMTNVRTIRERCKAIDTGRCGRG